MKRCLGTVSIMSVLLSLLAVSPTLFAQDASSDPLMQALLRTYGLKDGEVLRVVKPPFPKAREQWFEQYQSGLIPERRIEEVRSLYFQWHDGKLMYVGFDVQGAKAGQISSDRLAIPWQKIEGLEQVRWPTGPADLVVRADASIEQKLLVLAAFIEGETGQKLRITPRTITRPTIVVKGQTTSSGYPCRPVVTADGPRPQSAIFVTAQPLEDAKLAVWTEKLRESGLGVRPEGFSLYDWGGAAHHLGAPLAEDAMNGHGVWRGGGELADVVLLDREILQWRPTDPEYGQKMRRVLDNLQKQLGGEWQLEDREAQVFSIEVKQ